VRKPVTGPLPAPAPKSNAALYGGVAAAMLLIGAGAAWYLTRGTQPPTPVPVASPATIATPTAMAPPPTEAPAEPVAEATPAAPEPSPEPTPAAVAQVPAQRPTPPPAAAPRPTPTPAAVKPGVATPPPAAAAKPGTPAAPAPAPAAPAPAVQAAAVLTQAEAALGAGHFDQAATLFDEVLKLEPGNAKATEGKQKAAASAAMAKKTFVLGESRFVGKPKGAFENEAADPDYAGRVEFEFSPTTVKPGDRVTAHVFLTNQGKKPIKVADLKLAFIVDGIRQNSPAAAQAKDIAPGQRAQLATVSTPWKEGTRTWALEAVVTSGRGEIYNNRATWK
jgi:hypothetical protein